MDKKWKIFVSYSYDYYSGYFKAELDVRQSYNGYNRVIIGEELYPTDNLVIRDTSLPNLAKRVSKIIGRTRNHIEMLKQSIDGLPDCETYEF